ncbi:mechanosensitive ion channel family protein [Corynebacterium sp. AOP40-9SA-29]|uniref:mechanosensitive ion channel family protein n=1 Tax=Corynebacterium sp. AOP40-9SA-29 TaxID=3457677 RepID=UPI0040343990
MFDVKYLLFSLWEWIIQHGLPLSALLIAAILIPRVGRQVVRILTDRLESGQEETKSKLALVGALVYMLEIVAYFVLVLLALTNLGVPAMGAAIPATVVSAAIGFGSQNIIGDFLTGFFIISERHYGVGDVVTFDDTSGQITGTVVKLTLRSTQIRTVAGELVTVPNSKASVTINYSQRWSRAVVDLDIPMVDEESMADLLTKVETAAAKAVESAGVDASILGEIEVQPARSITPPAAAGQPWSVGMRVGVDTGPADQWLVERAIRANLVNTFWDRYQSRGDVLGAAGATQLPSPDTTQAPSKHAAKETSEDTSEDDTSRVVAAAASGSDHMSLDDGADGTDNAAADADKVADAQDAASDASDADTVAQPDPDDPATQVLPSPASAEDGKDGAEDDKSDLADLVDGPYESKTKNLLSFGGRFRPSTSGLFIALVIVGMLALFSSNPDDGNPGILSPDRYRNASTEVESTETSVSDTPTETAENTDNETTDDTEPSDTEESDNSGEVTDTEESDGSGDSSTNSGNSSGTGNSGNSNNSGSGTSGTDGTEGTGTTDGTTESDGSTQNQGQSQNQGTTQQDGTSGDETTTP